MTITTVAATLSKVTVTVTNGVRNPQTEEQSAAIAVESFVVDGGNLWSIDKSLNSDAMKVTPNEYGDLVALSVTRLDSSTVSTSTNVNVMITSLNPVPVNAKVTVQIPKTQFELAVPGFSDLRFYLLDNSNNVGTELFAASSSETADHWIFTVNEWCSLGVNACPANTQNLKF